VPPERIFVTPEAPAPAFVPVSDPAPRRAWLRDHGLEEDLRYLIYVGGFNPHKNLRSLVRAFARLRSTEAGRDVALLLVGDAGGDLFHSEVQALRDLIGGFALESEVHFVGFVPDEELRHLFAGAMALVLPSLEEGFGLPAVEAAACGAPCVATRNSPLPQLLEGGGLFVDPEVPGELVAALERMAAEPGLREELARGALERAGRLSWQATAEATRRALETIAAGSCGVEAPA
jgi:glycosyltransferase involved in cell wall biosynthesis